MATDKPADIIDAESAIEDDDDDDDDFTPSPRDALHTNADLCKTNLKRIVSSIPLKIWSSAISTGSGLFAGAEVDKGHEIYHVYPTMAAIDAGNQSFCHNCLKNTHHTLGGEQKDELKTKACSACRVVRFCSKQCQKAAWSLFHKDECKILKKSPTMMAQHLMTHRLIFWQQRGLLSSVLANSLMRLETHFHEFNKEPVRATALFKAAQTIRESTGGMVNQNVPWKFIPLLRLNCVPLRPANNNRFVGYAFDVVTAMINHSCDPNAFVFFEGHELRVRSLKQIAAGEEITICYLNPTLDVGARQVVLRHEYFFDCYCSRCKSELKEARTLLGDSNKLSVLHQAQREIINLMSSAVRASTYPGVYHSLDDLSTVETRLRAIVADVFPPDKRWPEYMEPLPSARQSLSMMYSGQGKAVPALRNALQGTLLTTRKHHRPEWVNEMLHVVTTLIMAGSLPPDAPVFQDETFPTVDEIRSVTYGYLFVLYDTARKVFGTEVEYSKAINEMAAGMIFKMQGPQPGSDQFADAFEPAQRKMLAWAEVPEEKGLKVPRLSGSQASWVGNSLAGL